MRLAQLELREERQYQCEGCIENHRCSLQITQFKKERNPLRKVQTSVKATIPGVTALRRSLGSAFPTPPRQ